MRTIKITSLILGLALVFGTSCKKYEEGPGISFRTKKARIANTWTIEKYVDADGDVDVASQDDKNNYTLTIEKSGTYTVNIAGIINYNESGVWEFTSNKEKVQFSDGGSSAYEVEIIKLKNKEWAIKDNDGNKTYYLAK